MYYVIQVESRHEDEIIDMIKKLVSDDILLDIFTPTVEQNRKYKDGWRKMTLKCFPGYVFVETNNPTELFKELYPVPAFTKLLGTGKKGEWSFIPLSSEESYNLEALAGKEHNITLSDVYFEEGNNIIVVSGPLQGIKGKIIRINKHKRICVIEIEMAGRKCEVQLGINIIQRDK